MPATGLSFAAPPGRASSRQTRQVAARDGSASAKAAAIPPARSLFAGARSRAPRGWSRNSTPVVRPPVACLRRHRLRRRAVANEVRPSAGRRACSCSRGDPAAVRSESLRRSVDSLASACAIRLPPFEPRVPILLTRHSRATSASRTAVRCECRRLERCIGFTTAVGTVVTDRGQAHAERVEHGASCRRH